MIGLFIVFGWALVGVIVAVIEKRINAGRDADQTMVTVLCIVGAIAGGFIGQASRWYVFGEPLGFVFSAAGAELLLWVYRSRTTGPSSDREIARAASGVVPESPSKLGIRFLEAFGWGTLCGVVFGITALVTDTVASHLYALNPQHAISVLIYVPVGAIVGFFLGAAARLARPRWTIAQMFIAVAVLAFVFGALLMRLDKADAYIEHGGFTR